MSILPQLNNKQTNDWVKEQKTIHYCFIPFPLYNDYDQVVTQDNPRDWVRPVWWRWCMWTVAWRQGPGPIHISLDDFWQQVTEILNHTGLNTKNIYFSTLQWVQSKCSPRGWLRGSTIFSNSILHICPYPCSVICGIGSKMSTAVRGSTHRSNFQGGNEIVSC